VTPHSLAAAGETGGVEGPSPSGAGGKGDESDENDGEEDSNGGEGGGDDGEGGGDDGLEDREAWGRAAIDFEDYNSGGEGAGSVPAHVAGRM
jgi:hypothetical protein